MNRLMTGFSLALGISLLAGDARGDEPPKPAPTGSMLNLADDGFVAGSLEESAKPGTVRWKCEAFAKPVDFALDAVRSIRFPGPEKSPRPSGAFGFELSGGDTLFGSIVRLDDKVAEIDVARLGRIVVERSRLRRIFRWKDGADLIYNGPDGLGGWREIAPPKRTPQARAAIVLNGALGVPPAMPKLSEAAVPSGPGWLENGGEIESSKDGATIQADVGLPMLATVEIELSWKKRPDFKLAIGDSGGESSLDPAFRLEVWDNQILVVGETDKEADVTPLQAVADGPGRAEFQIFLDRKANKLLAFSTAGEKLAEMTLNGRPGVSSTGVRLTNVRGDIRLDRLRVGRWTGDSPRPRGGDPSSVQLTDLSVSRGRIDRFDPATRDFVLKDDASGESRIAEEMVSNIVFARPDDATPAAVRAVYQDGTRISGEWVRAEKDALVIEAPGVSGPLRLSTDGLRSLDVLRHSGTPRNQDGPTGTFETEGLRLVGRLVDSGNDAVDGGLAWQPLAADSSSPIRREVSGRIVYRAPAAPKPAPTPEMGARVPLMRVMIGGRVIDQNQAASNRPSVERKFLHLRTGDIIPAEITGIDADGVRFKSAATANGFAPHSRVKAVEMATEAGGSIRVNKSKFERLMTVPRMQRESPPTHLIRSKNGDILRGRLVAMDEKSIRVEIRLEEKEIPRDRVSRIIWLHADETDPSKKAAEIRDPAGAARVQAVRTDGIRLTFTADRFADGALAGKSDVLGDCKVRMDDLDQILIGGNVEKEALQLAYQNWKLQNAPDPKSASGDGDPSNGTESALVGKPAPDFDLELLGGAKFRLAESKGSVVVLDFWATWCGPCLQSMPQIDRVAREFQDKGVRLIAVNQQETPAQISAMLERQKLSPVVALDREGAVSEKYTAYAIPQTVVIDREGKVTRVFVGGGPKLGDQLREALNAVTGDAKP